MNTSLPSRACPTCQVKLVKDQLGILCPECEWRAWRSKATCLHHEVLPSFLEEGYGYCARCGMRLVKDFETSIYFEEQSA